ncbi:hypothetical protein RR48_00879 [Papilio machaon]|uniref:Uncharacterized protein n=1 Tax=Papilio machaon TaxID=76193 RepID=A0A0N1IQG1_PAPMA|nr:hypothetical protein RR48_00879 [Papilio machaon]
MVSQRKRLLRGSMPVEGSSSSTTRGSPTIASAKESLRRVPPEQSSAFLLACSIICRPFKYASTILRTKLNNVSGGDSSSILDAMRRAMDVSAHLEMLDTTSVTRADFNWREVFYLATLGGATGKLKIKALTV